MIWVLLLTIANEISPLFINPSDVLERALSLFFNKKMSQYVLKYHFTYNFPLIVKSTFSYLESLTTDPDCILKCDTVLKISLSIS